TEAVATAEIVVTMLANADAVADVMLRGGTLDALRANATWAQMGTIGVEATERLAAEVVRRRPDVMFVDAPVSGIREPARNCRLSRRDDAGRHGDRGALAPPRRARPRTFRHQRLPARTGCSGRGFSHFHDGMT